MAIPWGPGPVFRCECLLAARRWQWYMGRVALVGGTLAALWLVWTSQRSQLATFQDLAAVGRVFFVAIVFVQFGLVMLAVPAATAGAFCVDKMRGNLLLMMATDLTDNEIVLGKLASHLVAVLGVLACGLPVLALTSLLGGVDPWDLFGIQLVIVGLAVLSVSVTLSFSIWAARPHEALMATYATWAVWMLVLPVASLMSPPFGGPLMNALALTHPAVALFGEPDVILRRLGPPFGIRAAMFVGSVLLSSALAALCVRRVRPVTVHQAGKSERTVARRPRWRPRLPNVTLETDPLLWREWHWRESTRWTRRTWWVYGVLSACFVVFGPSAFATSPTSGEMVVSGGLIAAIGLLLVAVTSPSAFAEERAHGGLDVLLATPLSSREIVVGKWWGAFRDVPLVACLLALLALQTAWAGQRGVVGSLLFALVLAGLVAAYGAVVSSVGIAAAVCQPRLGRSIALSVVAFLIILIVYPFSMILCFRLGPEHVVALWPSPFFGVFMQLEHGGGLRRWEDYETILVRLATLTWLTASIAWLIRNATIHHFDRFLGRMSEHGPGRETRTVA